MPEGRFKIAMHQNVRWQAWFFSTLRAISVSTKKSVGFLVIPSSCHQGNHTEMSPWYEKEFQTHKKKDQPSYIPQKITKNKISKSFPTVFFSKTMDWHKTPPHHLPRWCWHLWGPGRSKKGYKNPVDSPSNPRLRDPAKCEAFRVSFSCQACRFGPVEYSKPKKYPAGETPIIIWIYIYIYIGTVPSVAACLFPKMCRG